MDRRFVWLYAVALLVGIAAVWWVAFPNAPELAIGKGFLAAALATLALVLFDRYLW
jgi:hypothetical protein